MLLRRDGMNGFNTYLLKYARDGMTWLELRFFTERG
jgi:hypothetical protein